MKKHTVIGYEILNKSDRKIMKAAAIVAHEHHERWDGKGYPQGLQGENIHIYGRITAIADVFDALSSERCYKKAFTLEKTLSIMEEGLKDGQFDRRLFSLFMENIDVILTIKRKYPDK